MLWKLNALKKIIRIPAENTEYKIEHEKRTENDQWYEITKVKSIAESVICLFWF